MATALCVSDSAAPAVAAGGAGAVLGAADGGVAAFGGAAATNPPISFLYGHLHDSIRTELDNLSNWVLALEGQDSEQDLQKRLQHLKDRYHFLEQVYKYHSSVEDEVVYPALDSKVKNVTSAYSVEHQDEEYLFEHLGSLLGAAVAQTGAERTATIRELICKVAEIHITLRKHLAKEEAQLLPLLLKHFSAAEQAELVAQFLYCIPLDTVERVLSWIKPIVPLRELRELMGHLRDVIPDRLLLQLLVTWLNPVQPSRGSAVAAAATPTAAVGATGSAAAAVTAGGVVGGGAGAHAAAVAAAVAAADAGGRAGGRMVICPFAAGATKQQQSLQQQVSVQVAAAGSSSQQTATAAAGADAAAAAAGGGGGGVQQWPPLRTIVLFHHSIRGAMEVFASEAAALQQQPGVSAYQLAGLVERHRFLRSVCMFHTQSEEDVMFPEVLRINSGAGGLGPQHAHLDSVLAACSTCQDEHTSEIALFENMGRLLADVRAYVRRGRTRDVSGMLGELVQTAKRVCAAISTHMQREEAEVLPLLAAALGAAEQRGIVWHTLRAMPLRLLERVLPWLFSELSDEDADGLMSNLRLGAPAGDQQLVELLLRWAQRGRWPVLPNAVVARAGAGVAAPAHGGDSQQQEQKQQQQTVAGSAKQQQKQEARDGATGVDAAAPELPSAADGLCTSCGTSVAAAAGGDNNDLAAGQQAQEPHHHQQQQQQQQQQPVGLTGQLRLHREGSPSWASYDPCLFGNNTCELRLLNQVDGASPRKRQKLDRQGSPPEDSSSAGATPTAQAAAAAAAAAGGGGGNMGPAAVGGAAGNDGTATMQGVLAPAAAAAGNAPLDAASAPSAAAAAAEGGGAVGRGLLQPVRTGGAASGGAAGGAAASAPNTSGFNPIDHIFQFHKALRRELKQLESDAAALEVVVLAACEPHEQQQAQQQPVTADGPVAAAATSAQQPQAQQQVAPNGPGSSSADVAAAAPAPAAAGPPQARVACPAAAAVLGHSSHALQQLDGRFHFLWGIYRAHSKAEDEIVFPALESKEALHNVSHAYSLDHEQEEQLFHNLSAVLQRMRVAASVGEARDLALQLRRMCAAVRASLETHVRAEEAELWPLFSEHFSMQEQQNLVGIIIGRTGAEVLQALLPWVTGSFSAEEKDAMMDSLREATKNTMFDQWLDAVQGSGGSASSGGGGASGALPLPLPMTPPAAAAAAAAGLQQQQLDAHLQLAEIAGYLTAAESPAGAASASAQAAAARGGASIAGPSSAHQAVQQHVQHPQHQHQHAPQPQQQQTEVSGTVAESTNYVPGWEDIFNINQKQLEGAIRRVSNDPNLEPQRKAYLIQNIMVSRYIVAQQRRMQTQSSADALAGLPVAATAAAAAAGAGGGGAGPHSHSHSHGCDAVHQHHQHSHSHCGHSHGGHSHKQLQQAAGSSSSGAAAAAVIPSASAAAGAAGTGTAVVAASAAAAAAAGGEVCHQTYTDAVSGILGCQHYRRSARIVAPCCGKVFTCRLCHDDVSDHRLDRYAVSKMVCMLCGTQQPVAGTCASCSTQLASYYCGICHLWDDEPGRAIYHCPFCNVCRRGQGLGVDFFHCMQCNACMSLSLFNTHTCRERAMEGNCPVCHEYLFDSSTPIKELPCGHFLHSSCFAEYARYSYTCPICCKSIGDMSMYFQMLDSLLAAERHRLPAEYADKQQQVLCQDCGKVGAAAYHWVYHACPHCKSYNTRML